MMTMSMGLLINRQTDVVDKIIWDGFSQAVCVAAMPGCFEGTDSVVEKDDISGGMCLFCSRRGLLRWGEIWCDLI